MQLNLSTDIALRTLIYLGQKDENATIGEVADAFDIAKTHLMKVVMALVAAGLVVSERGRNGGIRLAPDARQTPVGQVIRLMENNLALVFCLKDGAKNADCPLMPRCKLKKLLYNAQDAFLAKLDGSTLEDLL